jgi:predicted O-methyltransferase YrrM
MFQIPDNYPSGLNTLELEYPWLTPGAIFYLDRTINKSHSVLEFGCGGSTMFFARRTLSVSSFETNPQWYQKVSETITHRNLTNVSLTHITSLPTLQDSYDIILIDCEPAQLNRIRAAIHALPHLKDRGIFIVDNYAADFCTGIQDLFPGPWGNPWQYLTFDDPAWAGRGTRIFHRR